MNKLNELNLKEENNNKKKNISLGADFEILSCFYSSINKKILKYFEKNQLDKKYKDIFLKSINSEIDRKIGEIYEYSDSEIFDSDNDNNNTFDGNNASILKEFPTIEKIIEKFIKKCKKVENLPINENNSNNNQKKMILNNNNSRDTLKKKVTVDSDNNKIIEIKKISESTNEGNEKIKMELKIEIKDDYEDKEQNENQI